MSEDLPELADTLPGAQRWCRQALERFDAADHAGTVQSLVGLLEAAGGLDVGNTVRGHLERVGASRPPLGHADDAHRALLAAARELYLAAEQDLRQALGRAGLTAAGAGDQDDDAAVRRDERAAFAQRVLTARRDAVEAVLLALAGSGEDEALTA